MASQFWLKAQNPPCWWPYLYGPSHPMVTRRKAAEARKKAQKKVR